MTANGKAPTFQHSEEDWLDWDMVFKLKERKKRSVRVTLHYAGRGKPLADPNPKE